MKLSIIEKFTCASPVQNLNKIIITFGIFLLCFIWIGLYYKVGSERQIEVNHAIKETANLARAFEEHTLRTIKSADQAVLFLKYKYEKEGRDIDIPLYIREGRFAGQPFVLMGVIDENGDFAVSDQVPFVPSNLKDREHFLIHRDFDSGALFISKPVLGRSSGKWSIQMTRRVNKPDGAFGGVAVVSVDPFYFTEFYKQVDLGKNSSITLVGLDGIVRARQSNQNAELGQDLNNSVLMERLLASNSGYYISKSKVDDIKRIYSYRALSNYPVAVVVGVDEEEALQSLKQRVTGYYLVAVLGTVVILLFIILLLRITAQQKRDKEALKQAHDDMEAKVLLRTRELFIANQELAVANEELQKANRELEEEITERKRVEEALRQKTEDIRHMAYLDALTGLPNRLHLNERLDAEMEKAHRGEASGCVMFIDLDDLKNVNDVFGHSRGDILIAMAGRCIVDKVGGEAFVARIGGDEFVVLLPGENDRKEIANIADKIIGALGSGYEAFGEHVPMSASVGIAVYPADGDTTEEILKNADNAMYAAKNSGKKCWRFYETAMQNEAYEKMLLTNSLRYAVEREELLLYYQPQVVAADGVVVGFEALLRWNSPEHGAVSPVRFIPLAEQSGLIQPIGQWVLRKACRFARHLADKGWGDIYVAVNISSKQIAADNFVAVVRNAVDEAGIEPRQLELEITESVLMISMEDAIRKLGELRAMGVRLSLDDFGTGFSSLTYLWHLPVGALKIDKSFIDMIVHDKFQAEIIGSIINMAHTLKMIVIAEGVENEQQRAYLAENHCDCIQGYIVSPPVPEAEAIQFLYKQNSWD